MGATLSHALGLPPPCSFPTYLHAIFDPPPTLCGVECHFVSVVWEEATILTNIITQVFSNCPLTGWEHWLFHQFTQKEHQKRKLALVVCHTQCDLILLGVQLVSILQLQQPLDLRPDSSLTGCLFHVVQKVHRYKSIYIYIQCIHYLDIKNRYTKYKK